MPDRRRVEGSPRSEGIPWRASSSAIPAATTRKPSRSATGCPLKRWNDLFLDLDPSRGIAAGERWERRPAELTSTWQFVNLAQGADH